MKKFLTIYISILTLILALCFSAEGSVTKQTITPNTYEAPSTDGNWLPDPDGYAGIVFFESFESPSTVTSGYDNTPWTETVNGASADVDPDETTGNHSGYGSEVLQTYVPASTTGNAKSSFTLSASYTKAYIGFWFYFADDMTTNNRQVFNFYDSSAVEIVRAVVNLAANTMNFGYWDTTATFRSENLTVSSDAWHYFEFYLDPDTDDLVLYMDGSEIWSSDTKGYTYGGTNIQSISLGWTTSVAEDAIRNAFFDDLAVRDATVAAYRIQGEDWSAHGLVTDSSDSTGWQTDGSLYSVFFSLDNPSESNDPKAVRTWFRCKEMASGDNYDTMLGIRWLPDSSGKRDRHLCSTSYKNVYHIIDRDPADAGALTWADIPENFYPSSRSLNTLPRGARITKIWTEVISGASGDALVTHEPTFGGAVTRGDDQAELVVTLRVNEETDVRLRYSTVEATAKGDSTPVCTGGEGTCTSAITATAATDYWVVFRVTGLQEATTYYFDVDVQQGDASWMSTYYFETQTGTANPYWTNLPRAETFPLESAAASNKWAVAGDIHATVNREIFASMAAKEPKFFIMLGDEWESDGVHTLGNITTGVRKEVDSRRGFHAESAYYAESIISRMPYIKLWSDHDSWENNSNKVGSGSVFRYDVAYLQTYNIYRAHYETTPYPYFDYTKKRFELDKGAPGHYQGVATGGSSTTLTDTTSPERQFTYDNLSGTPARGDTVQYSTDTGCGSWDSDAATLIHIDTTDSIMVLEMDAPTDVTLADNICVRESGGSGWSAIVNGNIKEFPTVSEFGIYPGMVVQEVDSDYDTTVGYGFVKSNDGDTLILTSALTAGAFANADYYIINRGGFWYNFRYGEQEFIIVDGRSKRDPNGLRGGDHLDGLSYPFFSETAASTIPKEIKGDAIGSANHRLYSDDYLATGSGTTTTTIKHTDTNIESEIVKWDMACAWDSTDTTFRGCALVKERQNHPTGGYTFIGSTSNPTDGNDNNVRYTAISCSGTSCGSLTMQEGDLVVLVAQSRTAAPAILLMYNSGGQTWTTLGSVTNTNTVKRIHYATFNGSWSASPSVDFVGTSNPNTLAMFVFRSSNGASADWTHDSTTTSAYTAPSNPYQVTVASYTTSIDYTIDFAVWGSTDDNQWGDLASTACGDPPCGWTKCASTTGFCAGTQASAQYRNKYGSGEQSLSVAFKNQATAGATYDVLQEQNQYGGDAGTRQLVIFRDTGEGAANGWITTEWAIPGLVETDRVRFFESGGSDYGCISYPDHCANLNAGHVQRTFVEQRLNNTDASWKHIVVEVPLFHAETGVVDKVNDYDGNTIWYSTGLPSDFTCDGNDDCYFETTVSEKPGRVYRRMYDSATDSYTLLNLYEVASLAALDNIQEWYYDETNDYVYIYTDDYITTTFPVIIYKPNFWEYVAFRKFIVDKYGNLNVIWWGSDRHFLAFDDRSHSGDPWFHVNAGPLHVSDDSHYSCREWTWTGKNAWYHRGMGPAPLDDAYIGAFVIADVSYDVAGNAKKITVSGYERDGSLITNASGEDDIPVTGTWLGNMQVDIYFQCPYGTCDYFDRESGDDLDTSDIYWSADLGDLDISSNTVINGTDNNTGIEHHKYPASSSDAPNSQYGQIKITSTSTDGDVGLILRSEASSGNRYALVYDEGAQAIKWQRYNWNSYVNEVDSETVNLADNTWLSAIVTGAGSGTVVRVWVDTSEPCNNEDTPCPYSVDRWNAADDTPDYTLTCQNNQPPTFVAEYETAWNTTTTPKTAMSAVSVNAGDVLVAYAIGADESVTLGITEDGTSSWVAQETVDTISRCELRIWTYTVTDNENLTVTCTNSGSTYSFGCNVLRFSGVSGIGATESTNAADGAPSLNITTTQANSVIVVANGDWESGDGSGRTWRTGAGSLTEKTYEDVGAAYTVYGGYHANAGVAEAKTVGLTLPDSQDYSIAAIELKGTTCVADTGTYAGIIIKDETGANSPTLDDFYSGDTSLGARRTMLVH